MLDESSQMTEPVSLLPMAKFQCEKLVLVGDPKVSNAVLQTQQRIAFYSHCLFCFVFFKKNNFLNLDFCYVLAIGSDDPRIRGGTCRGIGADTVR